MNTKDAVRKFIVESDPANGGAISYTVEDITPVFAARCLERGEWADGSEISDTQHATLEAVRDGAKEVVLPIPPIDHPTAPEAWCFGSK